MKEVNLIIPLGNGDPRLNVPDEKLLTRRLEMVREQTIPIKLTIAVDTNLKPEKLRIAEKYADEISYFGRDSYFAPGGIWYKIYKCWEKSDCRYVAWQGYDDYSSRDRFGKQLIKIESANANTCVCKNWLADPNGTTPVLSGKIDFLKYIGHHMPYMGSFLIRKDTIVNSGISEYQTRWSYYFEGLLYTYLLKLGKPAISDGDFFYYTHPATIANTGTEDKNWVQICREATKYSEGDCIRDWGTIPFAELNSSVLRDWQKNGW